MIGNLELSRIDKNENALKSIMLFDFSISGTIIIFFSSFACINRYLVMIAKIPHNKQENGSKKIELSNML